MLEGMPLLRGVAFPFPEVDLVFFGMSVDVVVASARERRE